MWLHTNDMTIWNSTGNVMIYILATGSTLQWLDYLRTANYYWGARSHITKRCKGVEAHSRKQFWPDCNCFLVQFSLQNFLPSTLLRPCLHVLVFNWPGTNWTGECTTWNFKTSPVLNSQSNDKVHCDQAVVHAQWSAMDHNSIIAPFLYRHCKRRRNRLLWVHPIFQKKGENLVPFTHYLLLWDDSNMFLNYFRMLVSSSDKLLCQLEDSLQRCNTKVRNYIQPVEMLAVTVRYVMFVCTSKENFDD